MENVELQSFILVLKLTVAPNFWPQMKTTTNKKKKKHWQWEVATCPLGTEAKQRMAGKYEGSKLQRGSLAKDAQRADCPSSLNRQLEVNTHGLVGGGIQAAGPMGKSLTLVRFHFGETGFI